MKWTSLNRSSDHLVDGYLDLSTWEKHPSGPPNVGIEISRSRFINLAFEVTVGGDDHDLVFRIGLPWFSFYFLFERFLDWRKWPRRDSYKKSEVRAERLSKKHGRKIYTYEIDTWSSHGRSTGFYLTDELFHINIWDGGHGWSSDQFKDWPWNSMGWSFSWLWFDKILGSYKSTTLEEKVVDRYPKGEPFLIWAPEGFYEGVFTLERVARRRTRWLGRVWDVFARLWDPSRGRPKWHVLLSVEGGGPPFPGKGENSYDLDDDATWAKGFPESLELHPYHYYLNEFALDSLRTRMKRAGPDWKPRDGWPKHCIRRIGDGPHPPTAA